MSILNKFHHLIHGSKMICHCLTVKVQYEQVKFHITQSTTTDYTNEEFWSRNQYSESNIICHCLMVKLKCEQVKFLHNTDHYH